VTTRIVPQLAGLCTPWQDCAHPATAGRIVHAFPQLAGSCMDHVHLPQLAGSCAPCHSWRDCADTATAGGIVHTLPQLVAATSAHTHLMLL